MTENGLMMMTNAKNVGLSKEEQEQIEFDKDSFSKLLRKVSLVEARLYAQMSYLGNLAYCIPNIQPWVEGKIFSVGLMRAQNLGRRKNVQCQTYEGSKSAFNQDIPQSSRTRFFFQPICDEYLAGTSTQHDQNTATTQQHIAETTIDGSDGDVDLHQTIAVMMQKRKHDSIHKVMMSNQSESSFPKKSRLSTAAFLPVHSSMMHSNQSSDDGAQEDSDIEDIHGIVSGAEVVHH